MHYWWPLSWPLLRTLSWCENFALCHSWWHNFHHLLPTSTMRSLLHLKEPGLSLLFPCCSRQHPPGRGHDDFGASVVHSLLLVGFWHQMLQGEGWCWLCSVSSVSGLISSTIVKSMEIYYCTRKKVWAYSLLVMLLLNNIKFLQQLLELHCLLGASYHDEGIQWDLNLQDSICTCEDNSHSRGRGNFLKND